MSMSIFPTFHRGGGSQSQRPGARTVILLLSILDLILLNADTYYSIDNVGVCFALNYRYRRFVALLWLDFDYWLLIIAD